MSAREIVDTAIGGKDGKRSIVVFGKSNCRTSIWQLRLIISIWTNVRTHQKTVPYIFIHQTHIGGQSDLVHYSNDRIKEILFAV
ncbi:hypothetical protein OPQ81_002763 [Rhizoctonia solani]|nr:hypothetical protein OPQ81_002763 [Rhizoctonia solani]